MTIQVTRLDYRAEKLRHIARFAYRIVQARRLLAIASILASASRTDAARAGMNG